MEARMVGDVLSQAEVESLLSAMEGDGGAKHAAAPAVKNRRSMARPPRTREKVTPYDFKRPERVGKEQMRALQTLHEGFGRNFGAALVRPAAEHRRGQAHQRRPVDLQRVRLQPRKPDLLQPAPGRAAGRQPDPRYQSVDPLSDHRPAARRRTRPGPLARRPLTEIELRLVSRITNLFLEQLHDAWENVLDLKLSVEQVESNPQLVQIVPPNEVVVLISFELTLGDIRGMMNFCIPFNSIERIGNKLSSNSWITYGKRSATHETRSQVGRSLKGAQCN